MLYVMDKALTRYYDEMLGRIKASGATAELRAYHAERVREFQHERLVHLIITLFFGGLTLLFFGVLVWVTTLAITLLTVLVGILVAIVLVLELFYISYYYRLENGVQRLYQLTDRLYQK